MGLSWGHLGQAEQGAPEGQILPPSAGLGSLADLRGWVGHGTHVGRGRGVRGTTEPTELSPQLKPEAGLRVGTGRRWEGWEKTGVGAQGWKCPF